jgi:hypothetical protein
VEKILLTIFFMQGSKRETPYFHINITVATGAVRIATEDYSGNGQITSPPLLLL